MPPPLESERAASELVATLRSEACQDPTTVTRQEARQYAEMDNQRAPYISRWRTRKERIVGLNW